MRISDWSSDVCSSDLSVWAAVAYATDAKDSGSLVRWCFDNDIPLKFWGRLDEEVPVRVEILNLFLHRRSPQFVCKLVTHHHAKVIWWRGFGVYEIGRASCRERVCQDVSYAVGAVSFKK